MSAQILAQIQFKLNLAIDEDDKVKVKVINNEKQTEYSWEFEKAQNRYFIIKEIYEEFGETGEIRNYRVKDELDPFW